jgi:hypothetical protein
MTNNLYDFHGAMPVLMCWVILQGPPKFQLLSTRTPNAPHRPWWGLAEARRAYRSRR